MKLNMFRISSEPSAIHARIHAHRHRISCVWWKPDEMSISVYYSLVSSNVIMTTALVARSATNRRQRRCCRCRHSCCECICTFGCWLLLLAAEFVWSTWIGFQYTCLSFSLCVGHIHTFEWMPFLYLNVEQLVNRQYLKQHIHHLYAKWILLMENVRDIECRQEYHLHFMCILLLNAWDYWKTNNAKCLCNATRCIETHWRIYSTTAERIIARISLFVQYHMQLHQIKMRASGFLQRFREVSIFITLTGKTIRTCIVCNIGTEDLLRNS